MNNVESTPILYWLKELETTAAHTEREYIRELQNLVLISESTDILEFKNNAFWFKQQLDEALIENEALEEENMMLDTDLSIKKDEIKLLQEKINSLKTKIK